MQVISIKEARALGLKQYFTGKPCKHGHISMRQTVSAECIECHKARSDAWSEANPGKALEFIRAWQKANPERTREQVRRWRKTNPERAKELRRAWTEANYEKILAGNRNWRAKKKGNGGSHTAADVADLCRLQRGCCAFFIRCGNYIKQKRHIDHIVPLVAGGSNDRSNLQILCPACNLSKKAKDQIAWAQERGLLL